MTAEDPVAVARSGNAWFAGIPFAILRTVLLEVHDWEGAVARLAEAGWSDFVGTIDRDVEVDVAAIPGGGTLPSGRGRDVFLAFWREWVEPWERLAIEASNYEARGDHALADVRVIAEGRLSGAEVELEFSQVWTVRGGRVLGYAVYPDRESAAASLDAGEAAER